MGRLHVAFVRYKFGVLFGIAAGMRYVSYFTREVDISVVIHLS